MSTRVILVRHAETPGSLERRFTGATDVPLTEQGLAQAVALGRRLATVNIDAIHVSPLSRCRQTAKGVTDVLAREVTIVDSLRECHFGVLENMTLEEAMEEHGGEKLFAWFGSEDSCPPEGESWTQVGERVAAWLDEIRQSSPGKTVLAVTHGGIVLRATRHITGAPHSAMGVFDIDPASVTLFQLRGDMWRLRTFNDTSHLSDLLLDDSDARSNLPA
jgi:ribonuclease H / adenosylcobalamin/alpha-ribazole phosphatase